MHPYKDLLTSSAPHLDLVLGRVEAHVRQIVNRIGAVFTNYTAHDWSHSTSVAMRLGEILSLDKASELVADRKLSPTDILLLIASAWGHDIGMSERTAPDEPVASIRRDHHHRTREHIVRWGSQMGLSRAQADILGRICETHCEPDTTGLPESLPIDRDTVHPRVVACCLRLADALDITADRAPELVYKCLRIEETDSAQFWQAHFQVNGVSEDSGAFLFSAYFYDMHGCSILKSLADAIDREMQMTSQTLGPLGVRIHPRLKREIREVPLSSQRCSFTQHAEVERLIDIIVRNIYTRDDVAYRELIQNSIDACTLRDCSRNEPSRHGGHVRIGQLTCPGEKTFFIQDDGMGLSAYMVCQLLGVAGRRCEHLTDIREALDAIRSSEPEFRLIAEFGIGFFSCLSATWVIDGGWRDFGQDE